MQYVEPATLEEAVRLLANDADARCLGGGATLVAMMNASLVEPTLLVGLRRIAGLAGIAPVGDGLRIGAATTHAAIAADARLTGVAQVVRSAAGQIAHPAIRVQGTIGGAVAHGDPAADFPTALVAADAGIEIAGPSGGRTVPAAEFFLGYLTTALAQGEIVTGIRVMHGPAGAVGHYLKFSRTEGDYATVSVAVALVRRGAGCAWARVAVGSVGQRPLRLDAADAAVVAGDVAAAGALLAQAADPVDDVRGSAAYRRLLIPRLVARAVAQAGDIAA